MFNHLRTKRVCYSFSNGFSIASMTSSGFTVQNWFSPALLFTIYKRGSVFLTWGNVFHWSGFLPLVHEKLVIDGWYLWSCRVNQFKFSQKTAELPMETRVLGHTCTYFKKPNPTKITLKITKYTKPYPAVSLLHTEDKI